MPGIDREAKIREAAYTLWENAGRPTGDGVTFWLTAEREFEQVADPLQETLEESFPASDPPAGNVTSVGVHLTHSQPATVASRATPGSSDRSSCGSVNRDLLERSAALLRHWPRQAKAALRERQALSDRLKQIQAAFRTHVRSEESNGEAGEILRAAPQTEHQVAEFKTEHAELTVQLDQIVASVTSGSRDPGSLVRERQEFERWVEHLKRHERAEDQLLVEVLETDLGAGD